MSRVGKIPIQVPKNVKLAVQEGVVKVEGPKGKLEFKMHPRIGAQLKDGVLTFTRSTNQKSDMALHGTARSSVWNMIVGVTEGYKKDLEIQGVGFKAQVQGKALNLALGFSHPVQMEPPAGVTVKAAKPTQISVEGIDKVKVGQFAAAIRKVYEVEPYKGKGVRYAGEVVRRKAGKAVTK